MSESCVKEVTEPSVSDNDTALEVPPVEQAAPPLSAIRQRLAEVFSTQGSLLQELRNVGYITDPPTAFLVWNGFMMNRPIIQEGPAGAGKTQLALSVSKVTGMRIVRLQCYPGITDDKAIGHFNHSLQQIFSQILNSRNVDIDDINREISSRDFFVTGPLLEAIESEDPCILLIDEVDKVPHEFEAMLLELLSVWEISIPGMGTIRAKSIPLTFITSNAERDIADPLRRRSVYMEIQHPTALLEAQIVSYKTPNLPVETHVFIAGLAQALRAYQMKKHPSISEMTDIASAMDLMGLTTIGPEHQEIILPLLAKRKEDIKFLRMKDQFAAIVTQANDFILLIKLKMAESQGVVAKGIFKCRASEVVTKLKGGDYPEVLQKVREMVLTGFPEKEIKQIEADRRAEKEGKKG
jgi:MoxR-like ATPase